MSKNRKRKYDVGYGKPPVATQFRKGQSGNAKGRPKGSLNLKTEFERAMRAPVLVVENGVRKSIPKFEAIFAQLINKAASGDPKAIRLALDLVEKWGLDQMSGSNAEGSGVIFYLPVNGRELSGTPVYDLEACDPNIPIGKQEPAYIVGQGKRRREDRSD